MTGVKNLVGEALPAVEGLAYRNECTGCRFGGAKILGRGDFTSPYVVVGEGPGHNELREGIPFVGQSGKLLLKRAPEFLEGSWYVTNAHLCGYHKKPDDKRKDELPSIVRCCSQRLLAEISAYPRKLIVALGNGALWATTGNYSLKITQQRGRLIPSPLAEYGILPILHPAAILRGTGNFRQFTEDLVYAAKRVVHGDVRRCIEPSEIIVHTTNATAYEAISRELRNEKYLANDIETAGLNPRKDRVLLLGVSATPERVHIFRGEALESGVLRELFDPPGNLSKPNFIWHNGKFDSRFLRTPRLDLPASVDEDTMLLSYALDENTGCHDLEQVAGDVLGAEDYKHVLKQWVKKKTDSYALVPPKVLDHYAAQDISRTLQIWRELRKRVAEDSGLEKLYTRTLIPASNMLRAVERRGFHVDMDQVRKMDVQYRANILIAEKALYDLVGVFNPNSPAQVASIIYDKLRIPVYKGMRSTDKKVLLRLPDHPFLKALTRYRTLAKAHATYVLGVARQVEDDGRVHSTFLLHGTQTGRLASRDPNLQNTPRLPELKGMYDAAAGYILLETDENQAELRSLAEVSGDSYLISLYNSEERSLHDEMCEFLFGSQESHESEWEWEEHRMRAKAVNFGIPYGREAFSLAEEFQVTRVTAQSWVDGWFKRAPEAKKFIDRCRAAPLYGQTIQTPFGNRKRHGLVTRENLHDLQNEASNFPHQNIASNINLHAAMRIIPEVERLTWGAGGLVNLVHDSSIWELPNDPHIVRQIAEAALDIYPAAARSWGFTKVPFKADAKVGKKWGSGTKLKI